MLVIVKYDEDQGQLTNILKGEYTLCMFYLMLLTTLPFHSMFAWYVGLLHHNEVTHRKVKNNFA